LGTPEGNGDAVEMISARTTSIVKGLVTSTALLSLTRIVTLEEPTPVGVPVITPALDSANGDGSEPDAMLHVYGDVPPDASSVFE
jgi:hypothetical protein